jgi:hypothetical protein
LGQPTKNDLFHDEDLDANAIANRITAVYTTSQELTNLCTIRAPVLKSGYETIHLYKLMPRWLMGLGIVVAVACELASLSLLNFKAAYFIPVCRFVSIVWMFGVSLKLPATITSSVAETQTTQHRAT